MWRHFTLFIAEGFNNFRFRSVVSLCSGLLARSTLQLRTVSCSYHESFVPLLDLRLREARLVYQCVEVIFAQFRIAIAHPCIGDSSRPAPMNDATAEHTNNTTWLLLYVMSACVCLSVCLSLSQVGVLSKRLNRSSWGFRHGDLFLRIPMDLAYTVLYVFVVSPK